MSLTGQPFAWLSVVLTLASFVGLVWAWPALGARRAVPVVVRAGALLMVNLLVLLTAAVQLNNQYLFYAGWTDLRGAALGGPDSSSRLHGGGTAQAAARAPVAGAPGTTDVATNGPLLPLPAGSRVADGVVGYTVTGPLSHITGQVLVTLPPSYAGADTSVAGADTSVGGGGAIVGGVPTRRYPVLETFSGYPGSPTQWVRTMRLQAYLRDRTAAHRIAESIVVSPQAEIPAGVDTECVNGSGGSPQLETWLARDVPDWIAAHFAVRPERGAWAAMGLSAGGWCAAMVGMLHPDRFGAAVVLGGYFRPSFEPSYEPYPAGSPLARRYDLVALARRAPPPLALWIETSHADPVSYGTSTALLKAAHAPLSVSATVLPDAGHRIDVWRNLVPVTLDWLGSNLPGFRP